MKTLFVFLALVVCPGLAAAGVCNLEAHRRNVAEWVKYQPDADERFISVSEMKMGSEPMIDGRIIFVITLTGEFETVKGLVTDRVFIQVLENKEGCRVLDGWDVLLDPL